MDAAQRTTAITEFSDTLRPATVHQAMDAQNANGGATQRLDSAQGRVFARRGGYKGRSAPEDFSPSLQP
jgi:hypothetical protein